jgi:predicted tellurium resistance membrane protein TerC
VARGKQPDEAEVHSLTSARRPHSEDQRERVIRYAISMAVRTLCVVLAVFVEGPLRWVFIVGAVLLPYVAVVAANAGRERIGSGPDAPTVLPAGALPPGRLDDDVLPPAPR